MGYQTVVPNMGVHTSCYDRDPEIKYNRDTFVLSHGKVYGSIIVNYMFTSVIR
jgi:hypothetical protein